MLYWPELTPLPIQKADQILVIEKGEIVEKGKHQELLEKQGRYFELYTYQTRM